MSKCNQFDYRDWQKNTILSQGGERAPYQNATAQQLAMMPAQQSAPQQYGFEDYNFYLDSSFARVNNTDPTVISWSLNALNNNQDVQNIVEIKLGDFWFPRLLPYVPTVPDTYFFRKVLVKIGDLPTNQGFLMEGAQRAHFEMDVEDLSSTEVRLRPVDPVLYFRTPVTSLTNFSLQFLVPPSYTPLVLPPYYVTYNAVSPQIGEISTPGVTTFQLFNVDPTVSIPYMFPVPIAIYIYMGINQSSKIIGKPYTRAIFATSIESSTEFRAPYLNLGADEFAYGLMVVAQNHIGMKARFTTLKSGTTNQIMAVHQ